MLLMRKPFLIIAALTVAITSCQKSTQNTGPFTCTCNYAFQRGFYWVNDTAVSTHYATGTSFTDAQLYCTNAQSSLRADTSKQNVSCYIH